MHAGGADATYSRVAHLPLRIDRCELQPLVRDTTSGFTKVSTVVRLFGDGHEGQGEDITWDQIDQIELLRRGGDLSWLRGTRTLQEASTLLGLAELFPVEPIRDSARMYRRWAFESAALDLALRQNGLSLQDAVGRPARPVRFVVSMRVGGAAGLTRLRALRAADPGLRFKLDPTPEWDHALLAELAALDCVDVVDMKGLYRNATVAMDPDLDLYRRVLAALPEAWIEDPAVVDETRELLGDHRDRITWDEPIHRWRTSRRCPGDRASSTSSPPASAASGSSSPPTTMRGARHRRVRRRHVRAGPGTRPAPVPRVAVHPDGPNDLAPVTYNLDVPVAEPAAVAPSAGAARDRLRWGTYDGRRSIREPLP